MLGSSGHPVWRLVREGQEERQEGTEARFEGRGQQKISSPSADASDAGPSPGWGRLPLFFFFFSFFSFGLANPNRRVEVEVLEGAWLCPSGTLFVWLVELSM